jgi:hypothetical protein
VRLVAAGHIGASLDQEKSHAAEEKNASGVQNKAALIETIAQATAGCKRTG